MSGGRRAVLAAALRCFAARGFAGTTIVDIESEAGLSPGAGGTYRHFRSKRAILEAVVTEVLTSSDEQLAPVPATLMDAARSALAGMDELRDLTRLLLRDFDQFPELFEPVIDRLIEGPFRVAAQRMAVVAPGVDAVALATLLVGALVNVKVIEALAGPRPGSVSDERLVDAWAYLYALILKDTSRP
jgi:AcrR family transcriptional regulator